MKHTKRIGFLVETYITLASFKKYALIIYQVAKISEVYFKIKKKIGY